MANKQENKSKTQSSREWLKYSGLTFQMVFVLVAGWLLGAWIDGKMEMQKPLFAICLSSIFLIGFFYKLIKELS